MLTDKPAALQGAAMDVAPKRRGDQVGLRVVTLFPAADTTGISPRAQLRIRFDQALDDASVHAAALLVTPDVAGEVRVEGDVLVFVPITALAPDTTYTVEVTPGLQGVQGQVLQNAVRWHFTTGHTSIVYSQRNASSFGVPVVSPPRLYLLDLATNTNAPVFGDNQQLAFDPRWSPDGKWLSYLSPDLGGVGVYHLENGTTRFYPTTTGETAVWHPQRNELILSEMLTDSTNFEVHLIRIDPLTETRQDLSGAASFDAAYPVEDNSPTYAPDGAWVAFRRKELAGPRESLGKQLWLMRDDGSEAHPLTQSPEFDHGPMSWSPDGRYLLYHRFPLRGPEVVISVWVLDVTSGQSWEVARPGQRPQWVP